MKNSTVYIIGAAVLFWAWRSVGAKDTTGHAAAMPSDPYGCQIDQWDVLNSTCPNAHPSSNTVSSLCHANP